MASLSVSKIIFFLFLLSQELKIDKIEIKGWRKLKPKISFFLPTQEKEIFELQRKIIDFYLREGFFDVKVNVAMKKKGKKSTLFYIVEENERYQIGKINIHSKFIKPDTLEKLIKEKYYSQDTLNKIIKKIAEFYWEIGFPFVKIDLKNFSLAEKKINFDIIIEEGEIVKINNLSAEGEIVINERVLKKGANFTKPFYFQKSLIEKMKKNIKKNLNLHVDNYFLTLDEKNEYSLTFHFPHQKRNLLFLLLSYLPNEKIFFLNLVSKFFNFLSNLEEFNLEIETWQNKRVYSLSYQQPYFAFFKKIFLTTNFKSFDTNYANFNFSLNFYLLTKIDELTINFVLQNDFYNSRFSSPSSHTLFIGQELIFNNKINDYLPGNYFSLKALVGKRRIADRESSIKLKNEIKLEFLFPFLRENLLFNPVFLLGNIFLRDTIYQYEKFFLAGKEMVRGYEENKYPARSFIIIRTHFRYSYKNFLFPYFFIDQGWGKDEKRIFSLTSYGSGLEAFTKNGILYFTLAFPLEFSPLDGRIYFGYIFYF